MQFVKINNNKLEVFISTNDLKAQNISIQEFMSNVILRHNFFYDILEIANKKAIFNTINSKVLTETYYISSMKKFVLVVTKLPYVLHINKKYFSNIFFISKFNCIEEVCFFCSVIEEKTISSLYYFNNNYYLHLRINHIRDYKKIYYTLKEFTNCYSLNRFLNENAKIIIKNNAIDICKRFV